MLVEFFSDAAANNDADYQFDHVFDWTILKYPKFDLVRGSTDKYIFTNLIFGLRK